MTAREHLAAAERLLMKLSRPRGGWEDAETLATALEAMGHGLVAVAIELGVPHAPLAGEAVTSDQ